MLVICDCFVGLFGLISFVWNELVGYDVFVCVVLLLWCLGGRLLGLFYYYVDLVLCLLLDFTELGYVEFVLICFSLLVVWLI